MIAQLASGLYAMIVMIYPVAKCAKSHSAVIVTTEKVLMEWHTAKNVIYYWLKIYASAVGIKISKRMVPNALDATISSLRRSIKPRNVIKKSSLAEGRSIPFDLIN